MKIFRIFILLSVIIPLFNACNQNHVVQLHALQNLKGSAVYGDSVKSGNSYDLDALLTAMENEEKLDMTLKGRVDNVCKEDGCWMTMKLMNGQDLRIRFKDKKITIPQSVKNKEVVLSGFAYTDTTAAGNLQHFAGNVTQPVKQNTTQKRLEFEASGIVVL